MDIREQLCFYARYPANTRIVLLRDVLVQTGSKLYFMFIFYGIGISPLSVPQCCSLFSALISTFFSNDLQMNFFAAYRWLSESPMLKARERDQSPLASIILAGLPLHCLRVVVEDLRIWQATEAARFCF